MISPAQRFVDQLRRSGRRRLALDALFAAFAVVAPEASTSPRRRERLRDLIAEAEQAGLLVATRGQPDRSELPALPRSVTLKGDRARPEPRPAGPVWPPELAWAGHLRLRPEERELLLRVQRFLRDRPPDEPVVPLRERSIALTGDEKLLERFVGGRLFEPGRLSLALLRCRRVHPPFVWREVGEAPVLLVVENHATYYSLCEAIGGDDAIGYVAFGYGNQFVASVGYVGELPRGVERIVYYGDLDAEGLRIPRRADRVARSLGLPAVEPAAGLYEALLRFGVRGPAEPLPDGEAREAAAWLPPHLRAPVAGLLARGERMAQEGLGYSLLRRSDLRRQALRLA